MASGVPDEPPCNTQETDEETIAFRKKRSRRVSFADREITSVHIFNRDEDYESPPESTPTPDSCKGKEVLGFFSDLVGSDGSNGGGDDDEDDDDDDNLSVRKSFLRPIESPSPGGSSTVGSATSNDEDNFFGPVSANFILPGRLSDSAASDDKHDITMDSTAFSMHFSSIVQSESGDLTTSTGVRLASEEKTPFQVTMPCDPENLMVLTKVKKLTSKSPVPINKFSGGSDSNDMSLIGESLHRYDYGRLSPKLEALLAEGSKDINAIAVSESTSPKISMSELVVSHDNENDCIETLHLCNSNLCNINEHDIFSKGISIAQNELAETKGDSTTNLIDQIMHDCSPNPKNGPVAGHFVHQPVHSPNQPNKGNKDICEVMNGASVPKSELLAITNGTPLNQSSEAAQVDLFKQFENGNQPSIKDALKESSSHAKIHSSDVRHASNRPHGSPLSGSIYSLSAKRQQILLDTTKSPRRALFVTPSTIQSGSISSKGSIKQGGSVPTILKSSSKLKVLEPLPHDSAVNDGIVESELRLPDYLSSKASPSHTIMEELSERPQRQQSNVPIVNLEEQLSRIDLKKGKVHCNGLATVKNLSSVTQNGENTGIGKDKENNDKSTKKMATSTSPSKVTHLGKNVMHHSLTSIDPVDVTVAALPFNSSPKEITLEISKDKRDTGVFDRLVSPLVNRSNQKLSYTTEHQGSLSGNLKLQDQDNNVVIVSRQENLGETIRSSNYSSPTTENITESGSVPVKINGLLDTSVVKRADKRQSNELDLQNTSETLRIFPYCAVLELHSRSPKKNIMTSTEPTRSSDNIIFEQLKLTSSYASPDAHRRSKNGRSPRMSPSKKKQTQSPILQDPSWSPCQKELHGDNAQLPSVKDVVPLNCNLTVQRIDDCHQRCAQSPTPLQDIQSCSKRKRTNEEAALRYSHHADKFSIQWSPKFRKVDKNNMVHMLEYSNGSDEGNESFDGDKALMNWTDISLKLSADINKLLTPSFDKLNFEVINMLEDILIHKQKVNICEMLCSEIKSRLCSTYDQSSDIRHKRVAETRPLLHKIVYGKAKMQLLHVKRERLLKDVQLLRTRVQECQMLKLNCVKRPTVSAEKDTQLDDNSCSVILASNMEGASDKVTTMKNEVETLEKKIKNLTKSFHIYCKMKGEPSSLDTVELVNGHLKKKACCKIICRDIQLWEVDDMQNRSGHHIVVLNYHGFINQSFKLNTGPNSSIFVANKLNDMNIVKSFPNMDACTAFAFVFNLESAKKYVGPKILAQETQRTNSLLRALRDVVEEVQMAQLEIRNLTLTRFHSPSAEKLDLQLAFFDFESGVKVIMTLDMTCLNCGVYPSEILPYDLQTPTSGKESLRLQSLTATIKAALGNLRAGYSRIIRLCRCVSQVMQSSGR